MTKISDELNRQVRARDSVSGMFGGTQAWWDTPRKFSEEEKYRLRSEVFAEFELKDPDLMEPWTNRLLGVNDRAEAYAIMGDALNKLFYERRPECRTPDLRKKEE